MSQEIIKITGLQKSFGELHVLKGIDLHIQEKEVVVIIGPSGSGKSTLLRCINYLEEPSAGEIVFDNIPLNGEANINEVRKEVGMVFQRFNLFPHMTVMENLVLAPMKVRSMNRKDAPEKSWTGREGQQLSGPTVRRSAAAGGHCTGPVHETQGYAL